MHMYDFQLLLACCTLPNGVLACCTLPNVVLTCCNLPNVVLTCCTPVNVMATYIAVLYECYGKLAKQYLKSVGLKSKFSNSCFLLIRHRGM